MQSYPEDLEYWKRRLDFANHVREPVYVTPEEYDNLKQVAMMERAPAPPWTDALVRFISTPVVIDAARAKGPDAGHVGMRRGGRGCPSS
jgi:hypothetical protein